MISFSVNFVDTAGIQPNVACRGSKLFHAEYEEQTGYYCCRMVSLRSPSNPQVVAFFQAVHAPLAVLEDEDADAPVSESCHRQHNPPPPLPPAPPPPLPPAPATRILPHIPTETTQKPQPAYILPIAIAMTETWRAQFPNGGGSSFTTMERPEQSLFGQVTLAVAREDLRHLSELRKQSLAPSASAALTPMVLVFSHAGRMKSMQASFSGVAVMYVNSRTSAPILEGNN